MEENLANGAQNGAFVIIQNPVEEILLVRRRSNGLWELPGGTVERGELARHAAQEEAEEESGALVDAVRFVDVAKLVQRPNGYAFLYHDPKPYSGTICKNFRDNQEVSAAKFMSFNFILRRQGIFATGSLRMILQWRRCVIGVDPMPFEGWLSNKVQFPRNFHGDKKDFEKLILSV